MLGPLVVVGVFLSVMLCAAWVISRRDKQINTCYQHDAQHIHDFAKCFIFQKAMNIRTWRKNLLMAVIISSLLTSILSYLQPSAATYNQIAYCILFITLILLFIFQAVDNFWCFHGYPNCMAVHVLNATLQSS
jgi:hypothetical protein